MMLLLIGNVTFNGLPRGRADSKCRIPLLPGEGTRTDFVMHPRGGCLFQFPQHVGKGMRCLEPNEQVDVVGHSADTLGKAAQPANRAAEIIVEACSPVRCDKWLAVFRSEHEVVMKAEIGGWHNVRAGIPSGCGFGFDWNPVVSLVPRSTTG